ncbi:hypothetical protein BCR41DRAFT_420065, partial [Lobosporangium transversale]
MMFLSLGYGCAWIGRELDLRHIWGWKGLVAERLKYGKNKEEMVLVLGLDWMDFVWGFVMMAVIGLMGMVVGGCIWLCDDTPYDERRRRRNGGGRRGGGGGGYGSAGNGNSGGRFVDCCNVSMDCCSGVRCRSCCDDCDEGILIVIAILIPALIIAGTFGAIAAIYIVMARFNTRALDS